MPLLRVACAVKCEESPPEQAGRPDLRGEDAESRVSCSWWRSVWGCSHAYPGGIPDVAANHYELPVPLRHFYRGSASDIVRRGWHPVLLPRGRSCSDPRADVTVR